MNNDKLLKDITAYLNNRSNLKQVREQLSDTNFTRGTWYANYSRDTPIIQTPDGHIIAVLGQRTIGKEEARANAELIKTAPKLYEALDNLIIACYDPEDGDCIVCGAQCAWGAAPHEGECEVEAAVKMLAQARGERRPSDV